jgi:hypothetical protein
MERLSLLEALATVPDPPRPEGRRGWQLRERRILAGAAAAASRTGTTSGSARGMGQGSLRAVSGRYLTRL